MSDTGYRKAGLALATTTGLLAGRQYTLAVIVVGLYLLANTILHLAGRKGIEGGDS